MEARGGPTGTAVLLRWQRPSPSPRGPQNRRWGERLAGTCCPARLGDKSTVSPPSTGPKTAFRRLLVGRVEMGTLIKVTRRALRCLRLPGSHVCVYYCSTYCKAVRVPGGKGIVEDMCYERKCVLFIGTRFSNLYTAVKRRQAETCVD